ncbi:MAG: PKD domain-containing protein [Candidatus Bipolaricaulota bacterium]|nr:PKD domain-containing protein [Candidatus Bipolaricaulota bacterium]MDW8152451.1 PKD domain-containing protein [Candidatus Bipolaricaulota bacterium]
MLAMWTVGLMWGAWATEPAVLVRLANPALLGFVFLDGGQRLLVATGEGLELWDVEKGQRTGFWSRPTVRALAADREGSVVAVALDQEVEVWDPRLLRPVQRLTHPRVQRITALAVSPFGRYAAALAGVNLVVWAVPTGDPVYFNDTEGLLGKPTLSFDALAFLSERELVLVVDTEAFLLDFWARRLKPLGSLPFRAERIAVDPQRRWVGLPASDPHGVGYLLSVREVDTGREVATFPLSGGSDAWVAITPDGRVLSPARTRAGTGLHLFGLGPAPLPCCFTCSTGHFPRLGALSPDGTRIAVEEPISPFLSRLGVYALEGCTPLARLGRWSVPTEAVALTPEGRWALRLTAAGVEVWDLKDLVLRNTLEVPWATGLAVHPSAPLVAVGQFYGEQILFWDWQENRIARLSLEQPDPQASFANRAARMVFTPDGTKLAICHGGGDLSLMEVATGRTVWRVAAQQIGSALTLSPDGQLLVTVGSNGIFVRDLATGRLLDQRHTYVFPREHFWSGPRTLLVAGLGPIIGRFVAGTWVTQRTSVWLWVHFSAEGRIVQVRSLSAPPGLGALLEDGRTLAVWKFEPSLEDPHRSVLVLWDAQEDREVHRWFLDLALRDEGFWELKGGVAPVPGARRVLVWNAYSSLRVYSVNLPPRDLRVLLPTAVLVQEPVELCAKAVDPEGGRLRYYWDLGDGARAEGECVRHTYAQEGEYPVRVLALDDAGDAAGWMGTVTVVRTHPEFAFFPQAPGVLEEIKFYDTSRPAEWVSQVLWDFGDGHRAEGREVVHRYTRPGTYTVWATVRWVDGRELRVRREVGVADVSCVESVPAPGAPRFYRVRLSQEDRGRFHFGDVVWIVRRDPTDRWIPVGRAVVFTPQADGMWVVLAEALPGLEPRIGDRVVRDRP